MRRWSLLLVAAAVVVHLVMGGAAMAAPGAPSRPPDKVSVYVQAERLTGLPGLDNVGRMAPGLYRGATPSSEGLRTLKKMGIKTIINLRHYHGASEERACRRLGIDYVRIVLESSDAPSDEAVSRFLGIVTDPQRQPVYFHCWRGKDRTGVMAAMYRMRVDGWPLDAALDEMDAFGFFKGWRDLRAYVIRSAPSGARPEVGPATPGHTEPSPHP